MEIDENHICRSSTPAKTWLVQAYIIIRSNNNWPFRFLHSIFSRKCILKLYLIIHNKYVLMPIRIQNGIRYHRKTDIFFQYNFQEMISSVFI